MADPAELRPPTPERAAAREAAAAVKIVDTRLLSLREIEVRLAIWPLAPNRLVVAPVRRDIQIVAPRLPRPAEVSWREVPLNRDTPHRLFEWRCLLPGAAWQHFPLRLQLDAVWLLPTPAPLDQRPTAVPGPWIFELALPDMSPTDSPLTPRLRPFR